MSVIIFEDLSNVTPSTCKLALLPAVVWWLALSLVVSKVDNRKYLVRNLPDKQQAADLIATVRGNLVKLAQELKKKISNFWFNQSNWKCIKWIRNG